MVNPWKILGVHRKSTEEEIQYAFYKVARDNHPDSGMGDPATFCAASTAYQILKTKKSRDNRIALLNIQSTPCLTCRGTGVKSTSKGLTAKVYTACADCGGSGFNIKKGKEDESIKC